MYFREKHRRDIDMKGLVLIFWLFLFNSLFSQDWNAKVSFDGIVKNNDLSTGYSFFIMNLLLQDF